MIGESVARVSLILARKATRLTQSSPATSSYFYKSIY
jgi:hypothetical protein